MPSQVQSTGACHIFVGLANSGGGTPPPSSGGGKPPPGGTPSFDFNFSFPNFNFPNFGLPTLNLGTGGTGGPVGGGFSPGGDLFQRIAVPGGGGGAAEAVGADEDGALIYYLGTAQFNPRVKIEGAVVPVYADSQGRSLPADVAFDGEQAWISADLTRYDELTYALVARRQGGLVGQPKGNWHTEEDLGSLLDAEGRAHTLYLLFPYAGPPNFPDVPPGYRFPFARLTNDTFERMGTRPRLTVLVWHCLPKYDKTDKIATLYDHDLTGVSLNRAT